MPLHYLKRTFLSPILEFIHDSRAIGITILACTLLSLILTNSPVGHSFLSLINIEIHIADQMPHSVLHWINDGLMTLFFLLAGMEIKREILEGELSTIKKSVLPAMGALGGMLVPAGIFYLFNHHSDYSEGWGIPMATDIAFSLGVASLLGKKVPLSLKIFLTALAIIDDLGAIIAIAVFYTSTLNTPYLITALILFLILAIATYYRKPFGRWNIIAGILLWFCVYNSGIHATVAGVLFAFIIPKNKLIIWENKLHHSVNFIIIPLFVLVNTAIIIPSTFIQDISSSLSIGIIFGLLIGKPLGIFVFCWLSIKFKWGELSSDITGKHLMGLGILASIGFTMSIFISLLAFDDSAYQIISKSAVMMASLLAILFSIIWFKWIIKDGVSRTAS
ncbi:MAG: Na+/H+ antiporter NhaA [Bacteroidota bacterium]